MCRRRIFEFGEMIDGFMARPKFNMGQLFTYSRSINVKCSHFLYQCQGAF
jgi:hypothetical protein